jgi:hypothetical protein
MNHAYLCIYIYIYNVIYIRLYIIHYTLYIRIVILNSKKMSNNLNEIIKNELKDD